MPGLLHIAGYHGGYVLRRDEPDESEFVVVNFFDNLEAVRRFAGENYMAAVFEPEARRLLCRIEPEATHYRVRVNTL